MKFKYVRIEAVAVNEDTGTEVEFVKAFESIDHINVADSKKDKETGKKVTIKINLSVK